MRTRQKAPTGVVGALTVLAGLPPLPSGVTGAEAPAGPTEGRAVQAIQKLGGRITRDGKAKGEPVVGVDLARTTVTDAGLKEPAGLKQLQTLDLGRTLVTNAGCKSGPGSSSCKSCTSSTVR